MTGRPGDARPRLFDATPRTALRVPYLDALFPDAQFVYVHRSPGGESDCSTTSLTYTSDNEITDFDVTAKKNQKPSGRRLRVKAKVGADESISVKGTGKIKVKGKKGSFKLKPVTKKVGAGKVTVLRLKLAKRQDDKKVKRAIRRYKKAPRKQKRKLAVKAPIKIVATDQVGNTETEKRVVNLR